MRPVVVSEAGGGSGRAGRAMDWATSANIFFILQKPYIAITINYAKMSAQPTQTLIYSIAYQPRKLKATEHRLNKIYESAKLGLSGDTLAYHAGMTPVEYRRLCEFDPAVEYAANKGKADAESELAGILMESARGGDSKIALEILKHVHGWVAKQQVSVEIDQKISIAKALEDAGKRVEGMYEVIDNVTTD